MRRLSVIIPRNIEVVDDGSTYEGPRELTPRTSVSYTAKVIREGDSLNETNTVLNILNKSDQIGGEHFLTRRPPGGGLMPRSFTKPHRFLYSFSDTPTNAQWIGRSEKGVKEYKRIYAPNGPLRFGWQQNPRLFSYNGTLYLLFETSDASDYGQGTVYERVVFLYRYDEPNDRFVWIKKFDDDLVDSFDTSRLESGSPDFVLVDDVVNIFYRKVNREEGTNIIVGYRSLDEDLTEWEKILEEEVPNTLSNDYERFRFRVSDGNDVLMFAYYGVSINSSGDEDKDFRSFLSFDTGKTLSFSQRDLTGVVTAETGFTGASDGEVVVSESLHTMFTPEYKQDAFIDNFRGYTVNFDLFFDHDSGSFIILKPGDPNAEEGWNGSQNGANYLMGIKTAPGDYNQWEPFLQMPLDFRVSGVTNSDTDPFDESEGSDYFHGYEALDLVVVPDRDQHTLLMSSNIRDDDGATSFPSQGGISISEFKIVDKSQILPGNYDEIIGYGSSNDPDYIFFSSLISTEYAGLVSPGHRHGGTFGTAIIWEDVCATSHRGEIIATARDKTPIDEGNHKFLAKIGPMSNMGEDGDYQHDFCRWLDRPPWNWYWDTTTTGTGTLTWNSSSYMTVCTAAADGDTAFIHLADNIAGGNEPPHRRSARDRHDIKIKFQVDIDSPPAGTGWVEVLKVTNPYPTTSVGHVFALRFRGDGSVDIVEQTTDTAVETLILGLDYANVYEFMVHFGKTRVGTTRLMIWYRQEGDFTWNPVGTEQFITAEGSLGTPEVQLGVLDYSSFNSTVVNLGDIHVGTLSDFYRPVFSAYKAQRSNGLIEPHANWLATGNNDITAREIYLAENEIDLHDGSRIRFEGAAEKDAGTIFDYAKTKSRNSAQNVVNGLVSSVYDFTEVGQSVELIFRNVDRHHIDALSLLDISGITSFSVRAGDYNETTEVWSNDAVVNYSIPFITLEVASVEDNIIILNNKDDFATSELIDYNILFYDDSATEYSDQFLVVDNFNDVIMVDRNLPALAAGDELRLMTHSGSFLVPTGTGDNTSSHVAVTLNTPANVNLRAVGEVCIGTYFSLAAFVDNFEETFDSGYQPATNDFGLSYMGIATGNVMIEKGNLSMAQLGRNLDDYWVLLGLFSKLHALSRPFPLIVATHEDKVQTRYVVIDGQFSSSPVNYGHTIEVPLVRQQFTVRPQTEITNLPPILTVTVDNAEPRPTENASFTASATDPEGESVTYEWDFGDGTATTATQNPTHSYTNPGFYVAQCTATDASGALTVRKLNINVTAAGTAYYDISVDNATPSSGTAVTVTVTARKYDGTTNTDENDATFVFFSTPLNSGGFDANGDTTFTDSSHELEVSTPSAYTVSEVLTFTNGGTATLISKAAVLYVNLTGTPVPQAGEYASGGTSSENQLIRNVAPVSEADKTIQLLSGVGTIDYKLTGTGTITLVGIDRVSNKIVAIDVTYS